MGCCPLKNAIAALPAAPPSLTACESNNGLPIALEILPAHSASFGLLMSWLYSCLLWQKRGSRGKFAYIP